MVAEPYFFLAVPLDEISSVSEASGRVLHGVYARCYNVSTIGDMMPYIIKGVYVDRFFHARALDLQDPLAVGERHGKDNSHRLYLITPADTMSIQY